MVLTSLSDDCHIPLNRKALRVIKTDKQNKMGIRVDDNVPVAFALVIGAGLSTAIGAGVVFFPSLVKYASRRTLAGSLGLSAGVMTYVSFVEIFQKSVASFQDDGEADDDAYMLATLCFFAGVVLMEVRACMHTFGSFSVAIVCLLVLISFSCRHIASQSSYYHVCW